MREPIGGLLVSLANRLSTFVEDRCCGSLAITRGVIDAGGQVAVAIDLNESLICLYERVRDDWIPPTHLSKETYQEIRKRPYDPSDPMTAFAMIFCSYGGKYAGGYLAPDLRWPGDTARFASAKAASDLLALAPILKTIELRCCDCKLNLPRETRVIYFDTPYKGTMDYKKVPKFNHAEFIAFAERISQKHAVVVSEFSMPDNWRCIKEIRVPSPGLTVGKIERLFVLRGGLADRTMQ